MEFLFVLTVAEGEGCGVKASSGRELLDLFPIEKEGKVGNLLGLRGTMRSQPFADDVETSPDKYFLSCSTRSPSAFSIATTSYT